MAQARPDRAPGGAAAGDRSRHRRAARVGQGGDRRGRGRGARRRRCPIRRTATEGVFCVGEAEPLGDGQAPWSGFSSAGVLPDADADLPAGDLVRPARRAARRRARPADGRGHRRVRRRVQGHRRVRRRVRARSGDGHAARRVRRSSAPRSAPRSSACGRCARCSSRTSSRAASTSSSTSPARCTTARGWPCRSPCACRPAAGSPAARSTPRTPRRGSCTRRGSRSSRRRPPRTRRDCCTPRSTTRTRSAYMEHKHLYRRVKGEVPDGRVTRRRSRRASRARGRTWS